MIEAKQFIGAIDYDSPNENIGKGFHRDAWNGVWRGPAGNMRFEGVLGTTLVPNALLPGTGVNLTINAHYDAVNQRLFFFNYNSVGTHGIYIYYTLSKTFATLLINGGGTNGDILGFTPTGRITSVDILYSDNNGNNGDLLYFIDSLGRPTKLNIPRYLANTYPVVKRDFIDVAKAPPVMVPQVCYENDTTVNANNLINALYQFAGTHIYDDLEESVVSSASRVPLPTLPFDPTSNVNKSQNARIAIYVETGDIDVKKIRIYGRQTKDGSTTDWFIIDTLDKTVLNISSNSVYRYVFYNDGSYITANPSFTVLLQDYVPQKANAQALLNGNVISYAGITEGYDYVNPSFSITANNALPQYFPLNGELFFAYQNADGSITIYLTGAGVNNGLGMPSDLYNVSTAFYVRAKVGVTDKSFNITGNSIKNIPTILFNLRGAATSAGWTFISSTSNSITVSLSNAILQSAYTLNALDPNNGYNTFSFAHYPEANYAYGIVYFDSKGRTNGVVSNVSGNIKTPTYSVTNIALITLTLSGFTPPTWATYYHVVRTDNLTYNKHLYWVTDSAYSNTSNVGGTQYAYLGISNIYDYNTNLKAAAGVVTYSFAQGDRIRILGRYSAGGTFFTSNYDYAILGTVVNPVVNGLVKVGTYVQIAYPAVDIGPDLKFDGTADYQNYEILLYSYKAHLTTTQNTFFEIGYQFGIGNPGTNTAYHMGNEADNIVFINEGDIFYRKRVVPTGATYYVDCGAFDQGTTYSSLQVNVPVVINTGVYIIHGGGHYDAGLDNAHFPTVTNTDFTVQNIGTQFFSVRLRGTIPIYAPDDAGGTFGLLVKVVDPSNNITIIQILADQTNLAKQVQYEFTFDATIGLPAGSKFWILGHAIAKMSIGDFQLRIDIVRNETIQIFEPSFSDIYAIVTNADNRPNLIDTLALRTYYSTRFRFSEPDIVGTNINNNNRFYSNNIDEWDRSFGDVMRMRVWQRELRVYQKRRIGHLGIYAKFIQDNAGNSTLVTTDSIITPNNIEYFEWEGGIGNQPTSLCSSGNCDYFVDPVRGNVLRLSLDGVINISEEAFTQSFFGNSLPQYLSNYAFQYGGNAVVLGCFNFCKDRPGEVLFSLQSGIGLSGRTISFIEKRNAWACNYDLNPDAIICAENLLISFSNGQLYEHTNSAAYANYYGTQYFPSLKFIFNESEILKKKQLALAYQSNQIWEAPVTGDIETSMINPQTGLPQVSNLIATDFELMENVRYAALLRDANSGVNPAVALLEGDYLGGVWMSLKLSYRGSAFSFIYAPYLNEIQSPRNG